MKKHEFTSSNVVEHIEHLRSKRRLLNYTLNQIDKDLFKYIRKNFILDPMQTKALPKIPRHHWQLLAQLLIYFIKEDPKQFKVSKVMNGERSNTIGGLSIGGIKVELGGTEIGTPAGGQGVSLQFNLGKDSNSKIIVEGGLEIEPGQPIRKYGAAGVKVETYW